MLSCLRQIPLGFTTRLTCRIVDFFSIDVYKRQDERIAALAPKILSYDRPGYFEYAGASGGFLDAFGYPFCRGRILDTIEQDDGQYDTCLLYTSQPSPFRVDIVIVVGGVQQEIPVIKYADTAGGIDPVSYTHLGKDKTVDMPNKIATIGDNAFQGTKLASIELPGALTTLGANAFEGCPALKEVTFAFSGWKDNEKYDTKLDNAVTSIGNAAFMTFPSLTAVKLPVNSLTTSVSYTHLVGVFRKTYS